MLLFVLFSPLLKADDGLLHTPQARPLFKNLEQPRPFEPGRVELTQSETDALLLSGRRDRLSFPSIDAFTHNEHAPLTFERISLLHPRARVQLVQDGRPSESTFEPRHFYIAANETTGVGLAVDPVSGEVSGFASQHGEKYSIAGNFVSGIQFDPVDEPEAGSNFCGNESVDLSPTAPGGDAPLVNSASEAPAGGALSYQAVVAIDTDSEWLAGFANDETAAMNWITDAFLAMNVFYERDVETRLLLGDVTLRVGSDPYTVPSDRFQQLSEFGAYWKDNMSNVERQFAAMFSGRNISGGNFSGIAWVNLYCEDGFSVNNGANVAGSYSFNAIGSSRTPGNTALFIGHEIGHNMGSRHTHCYNPPVDRCYNGESGCYSGTPECPSPGGRGTVMSYCHVGGSSGAGCGSNAEFHPTVQSLLEGRLANETLAGCIIPFTEQAPEFSSSPAPGATLDFGGHAVGGQSAALAVAVDNLGDADLSLACDLDGAQASSFVIESCVTPVEAGSFTEVAVRCEPLAGGPLSAQLLLSSNDADESLSTYNLECSGVVAEPEFASSPAAGSELDFGGQRLGLESPPMSIEVSNAGAADLSIDCSLVGSGAGAFRISACPPLLSPAQSDDIAVSCKPAETGSAIAELRVATNDSDEALVSFDLACVGIDTVSEDVIFSTGFENQEL